MNAMAPSAADAGQSGDRLPVLIVEDSALQAEMYLSYLRTSPFHAEAVSTGAKAEEAIRTRRPLVVLLDLQLPDMEGLDLLRRARAEGCSASFVVITANGSVRRAVEAMQAGAEDFLVKPFDQSRLIATVRNQIEKQQLASQLRTYREQDRPGLAGMIGRSPAMQGVYRAIEAAAPSKATVFITGESGTGKELCAEAVHTLSRRAGKPFVAINCAAIPRDLIESEIFGHVAGAFTGATRDRAGAATQADGGTLFLDEICELDFELQAKLLRFIQLETFRRVGSSKTEQADIRFVCATNRDPLAEVMAGRFREDLYYRLHVIPLKMPPLREREDDVLRLAEHFLERFSKRDDKQFDGFDDAAATRLCAHLWQGNVRELQNTMQQVVVLAPGGRVTAEMLPSDIGSKTPQSRTANALWQPPLPKGRPGSAGADEQAQSLAPRVEPLWLVEKKAIRAALDASGGDVQKAAVALGISASTIYRKLQGWQDS
jgi:two-component system, repressor protein LuxO